MTGSKGVDAVTIDNYARYVITSNEDHVVNAELSDRRYTVSGSPMSTSGPSLFAAIAPSWTAADERGCFELRDTDIGDGHAPRENAARASQQLKGLEPVAAWFFGLLVEGALFWDDATDPVHVATSTMFDAFQRIAREDGRFVKYNSFGMRLGKVTNARPTQYTPAVRTPRVRGYRMPLLADARSDFVRKTGLNVNWETGEATGTLPSWLRARSPCTRRGSCHGSSIFTGAARVTATCKITKSRGRGAAVWRGMDQAAPFLLIS
jgi:hypothetical protein